MTVSNKNHARRATGEGDASSSAGSKKRSAPRKPKPPASKTKTSASKSKPSKAKAPASASKAKAPASASKAKAKAKAKKPPTPNLALRHDLDLGLAKVLALALSPDHTTLAVAGRPPRILLLDLRSGQTLGHLDGHDDFVTALAFNPDPDAERPALVSTGKDTSLRLWDVSSHALIRDLAGIVGRPRAHTLRGQMMAGARPGHVLTGLCIDWKNTDLLATGGQDTHVKVWRGDRVLRTFDWHQAPISAVRFHPDSELLLSASHDLTLRIWNHETGAMTAKMSGHNEPIEDACWIDADRVASADLAGQLLLWDIHSEKVLERFAPLSAPIRCLACAPAHNRIYAGLESGAIAALPLPYGAPLFEVEAHDLAVRDLALSSDGATLVSGSNDGCLRVWDVS